ncbi:PDDEXK-like family protein [Dokdonia donghaensis]|uniref:PD-(D/E)XK nuclease superfamily protein n=1 Tax=Dokdonia donghaensis DSW-1 TaxID=1300343 RepID=A0A0A2GRU6_9FLAO|nr:PD-(D/E)XK nuclease family protein [Dokdonia donghaensis]ANH60860.1 hypothetical protein I597_1962 [Dokdonia donghaensis DSW-1]KGO05887.1 hypothetical protein NV36_02845 [Dokdonia donghaensis DSW-1]
MYKYKDILDKTKSIVKHSNEVNRAKGELFNIYNILNLKTNEVRTHSSFIAELLNPEGTHLMGNIFLNAFLDQLPEKCKGHIDPLTTRVKVEHTIGLIDLLLKVGGRIDILLIDSKRNSICIENKIDATDQSQQIERYCNYNKGKNIVVYLSKYGDDPDVSSSGELIAGADYHTIGYHNEIITWLGQCQRLAYDQPILRESIKQYRILIQQITHQLGNKEDQELKALVVGNLQEAAVLSRKYHQVAKQIKTDFRNNVFKLLTASINGFILTKQDVNKKHSNIWLHNDICNTNKLWFAIESFSGKGHLDGALFVGIFDKNGRVPNRTEFDKVSKQWIHHQPLVYNDSVINVSSPAMLQVLSAPELNMQAAEDVVKQILGFIDNYSSIINTLKK